MIHGVCKRAVSTRIFAFGVLIIFRGKSSLLLPCFFFPSIYIMTLRVLYKYIMNPSSSFIQKGLCWWEREKILSRLIHPRARRETTQNKRASSRDKQLYDVLYTPHKRTFCTCTWGNYIFIDRKIFIIIFREIHTRLDNLIIIINNCFYFIWVSHIY